MAKLILGMDGLVLKEISLSKERTTIGRKAHNDIQIDNLAVSGEHAVIVTILNDSFMEDLGSTNGTLVNGNPVKKHFLQNNDVIELGKYKLKFIQEAGAQAAQAAGISEKPAAPGAVPAPAAAPAPAAPAVAPKPAQPLGAIQLLSGGNAGKELELAKPLTTLGKPGVQVAVLTRRPQGYFITYVEGAQRPAVNAQVIGSAPHALKDHGLVEIAGIKMEFSPKS